MTSRTIAADAPAKINLTLEVLGKRADGFHELCSIVIGVGLFDRVTGTSPQSVGLTFECTDPTLHGDSNLASRAAIALARKTGCDAGIHLAVRKNIPIGGGMGGGSSDAAASLRICNAIWNTELDNDALADLGADIGSDVPLFFHLPSAIMSGRGEHVRPYPLRWTGWILLVFPGMHLSTADVYEAWRKSDRQSAGPSSEQLQSEIAKAPSAAELHERLVNELEPAVFRVCPAVAEAREALSSLGVDSTRVTGSGATLFRLFDDPDGARAAAFRIEQHSSRLRTAVVSAPAKMTPLENKD